MAEVFDYVFKAMTNTEKSLAQMQKIVRKQRSANRRSFVLAVIGAGIAIGSYIHTKQLEERVKTLEESVQSMTEYTEEEYENEEVQ